MKTIKQTKIEEIINALKAISVANGYSTDIGVRVEQWSKQDTDEEDLPLTVVAEIRDSITKNCGVDWHEVSLEVVSFVTVSSGITDFVRKCHADVRKCLGDMVSFRSEDESESESDEAEYGLGERELAASIVKCTVSFNTRPNDAYTVGLEG